MHCIGNVIKTLRIDWIVKSFWTVIDSLKKDREKGRGTGRTLEQHSPRKYVWVCDRYIAKDADTA